MARVMEPSGPGFDCSLCPRLAAFRRANRTAYPSFHNAPVASFGPLSARILVVGLAPGLKGANRTGRPFTGDYAGTLLYGSLIRHGFAAGIYGAAIDDGLELVSCRITNAVRCVPPENKPLPDEIATCNPFLASEITAMAGLRAILALGAIAHDAVIAALGLRRAQHRFAHGNQHPLANGRALFDSYHCSRLNTNTGRLTEAMFDRVMTSIRRRVDSGR